MKNALFAAASLLVFSTGALAQSTVSVATDPNAPTSNFGSPTNTATAGYTITLNDDGSKLNGTIQQTGGQAAGEFANLYFDLNPTVGNGSDLGFEIGSTKVNDAFIPGTNSSTTIDPSLYSVMTSTDANGLIDLMFSLDNSLFTGPIAGLAYSPGQTFEGTQTLRLSQSLSYSVAGGATYGANRLGAFSVSGAVPEPATWAMMLLGFGAIGFAMRRKRAPVLATA